ncbi:MAG: AIPR family protein [Acidimicrobiia bacterium]
MPSRAQTRHYDLVKRLANTAEAGGLAKDRSILLLWFLRNVVGLDDLDAYEFVTDGDDDAGIDALYLEESSGDETHETLVVYQSKYTEAATAVGPNTLTGLLAASSHFKSHASITEFLNGRVESQLRDLIAKFGLVAKLSEGHFESGLLRVRLVFITTGILNAPAKRLVAAQQNEHGAGYLTVYDLNRLGPIATAITTQEIPDETVEIPVPRAARVVLGASPNRIVMVAVRATDIVRWPGIDDRTLFELNVRRELRPNRVREQLDAAIGRSHDHKDFLAYHNGLTVVCDSLALGASKITLRRPSVVNGAQSVVAFARADSNGRLTDDLRVFVKIVETKNRPALAQQVSRRSNTQNPVNPRNLVSNTGRQRRLVTEFSDQFPNYYYETKPDATVSAATGVRVIQNDDAAQLLCAVFNAMPWLAVKRNSLFESDNHSMIFSEQITPAHIVLVDTVGRIVDENRTRFPAAYRRSWRLTRIVAVYLAGQVLRATEDAELKRVLNDAEWAVSDDQRLRALLTPIVRLAAATLKIRRDAADRDERFDDFKVDFKRESALQELRDKARDNYLLHSELEA